jgi:predicted DCC family thiol-disulfide oxidoreductase YuxK
MEMPHAIILFDGVCNLCNGTVQFVLKRDSRAVFHFAALQSEAGQRLLAEHGFDAETAAPDSIILITETGQMFTRSEAALRIGQRLGGAWPVLGIFLLVPHFIRDAVYRWVARNRYKLFGKRDTCMLPLEGWKERFL